MEDLVVDDTYDFNFIKDDSEYSTGTDITDMKDEICYCKSAFSMIIDSNPLLSRNEEVELANIIRNGESAIDVQNAREKLFSANIRLVFKIARYFQKRTNLEIEDIISAGLNGLMIAVDKFNPEEFKSRFSTYAYSWIKVYISRSANSFKTSVYIPSNLLEKYMSYIKAICESPSITDKELAERLNVSINGLERIRNSGKAYTFSINTKVCNDDGDSCTHEDFIHNEDEIYSDEITARNDESRYIGRILQESLSELTEIQREIISIRYLGDDKVKFSGISDKYGITKQRVQQIEASALKTLRKKIQYKKLWY